MDTRVNTILIHSYEGGKRTSLWPLQKRAQNAGFWERGVKTLPFHRVILRNGTIVDGRSLDRIGSHPEYVGLNRMCIHVCLIGDGDYTDRQFASLRKVIREIYKHVGAPMVVMGVDTFDAEKDLGFDASKFAQESK